MIRVFSIQTAPTLFIDRPTDRRSPVFNTNGMLGAPRHNLPGSISLYRRFFFGHYFAPAHPKKQRNALLDISNPDGTRLGQILLV